MTVTVRFIILYKSIGCKTESGILFFLAVCNDFNRRKVMEKQNVYEKPVTLGNILKFAVPTIAMTVFMSFYTMVDGLFVSNLIGTNALSAINLTAPVIQLVTAILPCLPREEALSL